VYNREQFFKSGFLKSNHVDRIRDLEFGDY